MAQIFDLDDLRIVEDDGMGLFHKKDSLIRRFVSKQRTRLRDFRVQRQVSKALELSKQEPLRASLPTTITRQPLADAPQREGIFSRFFSALRGTSVDFPQAGGAPVFTLPGGSVSDFASFLPRQLQIETPLGPQPLSQAFDPGTQIARAGTQFSPILIVAAVVGAVLLFGGRRRGRR